MRIKDIGPTKEQLKDPEWWDALFKPAVKMLAIETDARGGAEGVHLLLGEEKTVIPSHPDNDISYYVRPDGARKELSQREAHLMRKLYDPEYWIRYAPEDATHACPKTAVWLWDKGPQGWYRYDGGAWLFTRTPDTDKPLVPRPLAARAKSADPQNGDTHGRVIMPWAQMCRLVPSLAEYTESTPTMANMWRVFELVNAGLDAAGFTLYGALQAPDDSEETGLLFLIERTDGRTDATGYTKREDMARHMMVSPHCQCRSDDHHGRARWAINEADALLAELEKTL